MHHATDEAGQPRDAVPAILAEGKHFMVTVGNGLVPDSAAEIVEKLQADVNYTTTGKIIFHMTNPSEALGTLKSVERLFVLVSSQEPTKIGMHFRGINFLLTVIKAKGRRFRST